MHQTKKGNKRYFGRKIHLGAHGLGDLQMLRTFASCHTWFAKNAAQVFALTGLTKLYLARRELMK
jgi:hypothetical protein